MKFADADVFPNRKESFAQVVAGFGSGRDAIARARQEAPAQYVTSDAKIHARERGAKLREICEGNIARYHESHPASA